MPMGSSSLPPPACVLARHGADTPADGGKRIGLAGDPVDTLVVAGSNGQDVRPGVGPDWAGGLATYGTLVVDGIWDFNPIGHG